MIGITLVEEEFESTVAAAKLRYFVWIHYKREWWGTGDHKRLIAAFPEKCDALAFAKDYKSKVEGRDIVDRIEIKKV